MGRPPTAAPHLRPRSWSGGGPRGGLGCGPHAGAAGAEPRRGIPTRGPTRALGGAEEERAMEGEGGGRREVAGGGKSSMRSCLLSVALVSEALFKLSKQNPPGHGARAPARRRPGAARATYYSLRRIWARSSSSVAVCMSLDSSSAPNGSAMVSTQRFRSFQKSMAILRSSMGCTQQGNLVARPS